jgi:hypothetical protein
MKTIAYVLIALSLLAGVSTAVTAFNAKIYKQTGNPAANRVVTTHPMERVLSQSQPA